MFDSIDYLASGNERQKSAYATIVKHGLMDDLRTYDPILTGTIPIDIDVPGSDLDIICCYEDGNEFENLLVKSYGHKQNF